MRLWLSWIRARVYEIRGPRFKSLQAHQIFLYAAVAQLEEHETFNFGALGSSPSSRTSQEQRPRLSCIGQE